jgi:hypothetical protein
VVYENGRFGVSDWYVPVVDCASVNTEGSIISWFVVITTFLQLYEFRVQRSSVSIFVNTAYFAAIIAVVIGLFVSKKEVIFSSLFLLGMLIRSYCMNFSSHS